MTNRKKSKLNIHQTDKVIRATVCVELPYDNELLNYNHKLNKKILEVLSDGNFACSVRAGSNIPYDQIPINRHKEA